MFSISKKVYHNSTSTPNWCWSNLILFRTDKSRKFYFAHIKVGKSLFYKTGILGLKRKNTATKRNKTVVCSWLSGLFPKVSFLQTRVEIFLQTEICLHVSFLFSPFIVFPYSPLKNLLLCLFS